MAIEALLIRRLFMIYGNISYVFELHFVIHTCAARLTSEDHVISNLEYYLVVRLNVGFTNRY